MTRTTTIGRLSALCLAGAAFALAPAASAQEPAAPANPAPVVFIDHAGDGSMYDRVSLIDQVETFVDPRPVIAPVPPSRPRVAAAQPRLRTAAALPRPARATAAPYLVVSNDTGRRGCNTVRCLIPLGISY